MRIRKGLSSFVLLALEKSVDGFIRFEDFGSHTYKYLYGIPQLKKSALAKAIKRLRENGMVDFLDEKELVVRLTDEGRNQVLWTKLKFNEEKWDGKWRLVIWDIPEKRRKARDLLRAKLKELGFKKWQQSVWATKKNCTRPLRGFIKQIGIQDWVKVLECSDVGDNLP